MVICCLGDSLTEGDYGIKWQSGIANIQKENYPYFLGQLTGCEVRNFGKCGFDSTMYLNHYKSGVVKVDDADIIIVMLGTNGGHSNTEETLGNNNYRELIRLLQKDSKAKIFLCTPPHCSANPKFPSHPFVGQVATAVEFVKRVAKEFNLPLIDVAASKRITVEHEEEYQGNDGLHFIKKGYQVLAEEIYQGIKSSL